MRTELVEVPVTVYAPLPAALTDPLPYPEPPPANCQLGDVPAVCVLDALLWARAWRGVVDRANADRLTTARITSQASLTERDEESAR